MASVNSFAYLREVPSMYSVTCPECGRPITLEEAAGKVKLRCGQCGNVFVAAGEAIRVVASGRQAEAPDVATSLELQELAAAGQVRPAGRHGAGKKTPAWAPVVLLTALVAAGAAAWGLRYFLKHPIQVVRDPTGRIVYRGRDREQADRMHEKVNLATASQPTGPIATAPAGEQVAAGEPDARNEAPDAPLKGDANIVVKPDRKPAGVRADGGYITGTLTNMYQHALADVQVVVALYDADGKRLAEPGATLRWIPPGIAVPFSVRFEGVKPDAIDSVEGAGLSASPVGPKDVCLPVDPLRCQRLVAGGKVVINGEVRNDTGADLMDAEIFCDLLTEEGVFVKTVKGGLDDATTLKSNESRGFNVTFDPAGSGYDAGVITRFAIRLVATKL